MGKRKGRDDMAAKSANLYARIEPDVKEQAEEILATLGIPASNAIKILLICRFSDIKSKLFCTKDENRVKLF